MLEDFKSTQMLASVTDAAEALLVLEAGVDIIDLKNPAKGALGALPIPVVTDIVQVVNKRAPISATIGDLPMEPALILEAAQAMLATGVDMLKIGFFGQSHHLECLQALKPLAGQTKLIAVLFADEQPDIGLIKSIAEAGFFGVMLDTAKKKGGSLLDHLSLDDLYRFINEASHFRLISGLAGSLTTIHIQSLSALNVNYLGFRGALCEDGVRDASVNLRKVKEIKSILSSVNKRETVCK